MTTTFTPLQKGFTWTPSSTGGGAALPAGESPSGFTIGIRADGDTTHGPGNYSYSVIVTAGQTTETPAQITAALSKALAPGNYWAALSQTDTLNGASATSAWTGEVPFSIPPVIVPPDQPTGFIAA